MNNFLPQYEGFVVDLASEIARIVGFNYTVVPTVGYGSKGKDGRWNGMIREILEEVEPFLCVPKQLITIMCISIYNQIMQNINLLFSES